jgi:micrococcal nuclease
MRLLVTACAAFGAALVPLGADLAASPLVPCAPQIEVSGVRVARVEANGVIVLEDGRAVHLEGIRLPAGPSDHAPTFLADQATRELSGLATGRLVTLAARPPKEDRYGRLRAQVFIANTPEGAWLQAAMLAKGLARVEVAPDRRECAAPLDSAEDNARMRKLAIWGQPAYSVRSPEQIAGDAGTFQLVEGQIVAVDEIGGQVYLEFGHDPHRAPAAAIAHDDLKAFRQSGIDPFSYASKRVRLRGWVERRERPVIEIAVPEAIEVLDGQ